MALLQVQIDNRLKKALHGKSKVYGVPVSSLVKIVLVKSFLPDERDLPGNIFNADRDNRGKGIPLGEMLTIL